MQKRGMMKIRMATIEVFILTLGTCSKSERQKKKQSAWYYILRETNASWLYNCHLFSHILPMRVSRSALVASKVVERDRDEVRKVCNRRHRE
mmetsp:Transcript_16825/g.25174  ORF Transcript_16825/g.25174 Transcript_16825/m.25174 type:complete len:92 (-) Transcript_16825:646-921(-)